MDRQAVRQIYRYRQTDREEGRLTGTKTDIQVETDR
jgi:hypothetical protein